MFVFVSETQQTQLCVCVLRLVSSSVCVCVMDEPCLLASATVGSRQSVANTLHAEGLGASVSVAAIVSHLLGLPLSSSVIMSIYRLPPLVPDVFVPRSIYDQAEMSCITYGQKKNACGTFVFNILYLYWNYFVHSSCRSPHPKNPDLHMSWTGQDTQTLYTQTY